MGIIGTLVNYWLLFLKIWQYFETFQNEIEKKKSGTEGVQFNNILYFILGCLF